MSEVTFEIALNRRRWIKLVSIAAAAAPFAEAAVGRLAFAADTVSESDPAAAALKYKADATKAPERKDASAICDNCAYYTGKPGSSSGPCAALGNRLVAAKGWCTSWEGY